VFTRPPSVSDATIIRAIADHWGLAMDRAEYAPVGFGSHHWLAGTATSRELFVTVDDLSAKTRFPHEPLDGPFERLDAAFTTARDLADAGCDFVIAPQRARDGRVVHHLDERYTVACFRYLDGLIGHGGTYRSDLERDTVARHLVVLHELDQAIVARCQMEDFELSNRDELLRALDEIDRPWDGGPYAESARDLLRTNRDGVARLLERYDDVVIDARQAHSRWRLTHGEPHGSNVLTTHEGIYLIDWDTALVAPRERDVWHLDPDNTTAARLYTDVGGPALDDRLLDLYRAQWDLSEIAGYTTLFRASHEATDDARASLDNLTHYLVQTAP
jgi:hypothetical protein